MPCVRDCVPPQLLFVTALTLTLTGCANSISTPPTASTPSTVVSTPANPTPALSTTPEAADSQRVPRLWQDKGNEDVIKILVESNTHYTGVSVFRWENALIEGWFQFDSEESRFDLGEYVTTSVNELKNALHHRENDPPNSQWVTGFVMIKSKSEKRSIPTAAPSPTPDGENTKVNPFAQAMASDRAYDVEVSVQVNLHYQTNDRKSDLGTQQTMTGRRIIKKGQMGSVANVNNDHFILADGDAPWLDLKLVKPAN